MHPLVVLAIVVAVLLIIALIPFGVKLNYLSDEFTVYVRFAGLSVPVYPPKSKKKTKPKKTEKPKKEKKPLPGDKWELVQLFLPILVDAGGRLRRGIVINHLSVSFDVGGDDPAQAAIRYGQIQAILGGTLALLERGFTVKNRDICVDLDFANPSITATATAQVTLTIGQAVALVVHALPPTLQGLSTLKGE